MGSSKVYGFYLADEPLPSATTAANLKAESDWIHANFPGVKTFIVQYNSGSDVAPQFYYTPANTDIDLFGLDPYPVQTNRSQQLRPQYHPARGSGRRNPEPFRGICGHSRAGPGASLPSLRRWGLCNLHPFAI
jgi:hypothetical protein